MAKSKSELSIPTAEKSLGVYVPYLDLRPPIDLENVMYQTRIASQSGIEQAGSRAHRVAGILTDAFNKRGGIIPMHELYAALSRLAASYAGAVVISDITRNRGFISAKDHNEFRLGKRPDIRGVFELGAMRFVAMARGQRPPMRVPETSDDYAILFAAQWAEYFSKYAAARSVVEARERIHADIPVNTFSKAISNFGDIVVAGLGANNLDSDAKVDGAAWLARTAAKSLANSMTATGDTTTAELLYPKRHWHRFVVAPAMRAAKEYERIAKEGGREGSRGPVGLKVGGGSVARKMLTGEAATLDSRLDGVVSRAVNAGFMLAYQPETSEAFEVAVLDWSTRPGDPPKSVVSELEKHGFERHARGVYEYIAQGGVPKARRNPRRLAGRKARGYRRRR